MGLQQATWCFRVQLNLFCCHPPLPDLPYPPTLHVFFGVVVAFEVMLAPVVQKVDRAIHWINLYPLDSAIGFPNTYLAVVVQTLDSAIHRIKIYPMDSAIIGFPNTYLLDSDLSGPSCSKGG